MAYKKPDFAVDLTPMGVNLWQQGRSGEWLCLGFVPDTAENFSQAIESLRMGARRQGRNAVEIRIARSEVYFTSVTADRVPEKLTDQAILALVADRLPFRNKTGPMVVDTCLRASGDLAVAVVPAAVLATAAEFAKRHGFVPSYFTTLNNPMMFPSEPRFRLIEPTRPLYAPRLARKRRNELAAVAFVAVAALGLARIGQVLLAPDGPVAVVAEAGTAGDPIDTVMASEQTTALRLHLPETIASESVGPTPVFAADITAPRPFPNIPTLISAAAEGAISDMIPARPHVRRTAFGETQEAANSGFDSTGLTISTRRLLNNSFITIEEPVAGGIGRKTIRILPSDLGRGSHNRRFEPRTFVRVAQAQAANDASGLPDVDNPRRRVTEDGVPVFEGTPDVVPPPRPGSTVAAPNDDLRTFSDSIAQVLDGPDAAAVDIVDITGIRIQKASLGTIRPRPNPFLKKAPPAQAKADSGYPVQGATATTLRPKPRPASLVRKLQQRDINAAAALAAKEAIRENMPTENALFVSLVPKPRPESMQQIVNRTKPGLTTARAGSKAVVRTAPAGSGQSSGTMTTSNTPKSVAALATESARIDKHSLSLIGIFGASSTRRALLRLPSGRYIKVKQGDDVSGWKVSAIGESSVRIKKGSRDEVLRMPE